MFVIEFYLSFFLDKIRNGVLNSITEKTLHDSLQSTLDIRSKEVTDIEAADISSFYINADKVLKSNLNMRVIVIKLEKPLQQADMVCSGWSHRKINSVDCGFLKEGSLVGYGDYAEWPTGVPGAHKVIKTKSDGN